MRDRREASEECAVPCQQTEQMPTEGKDQSAMGSRATRNTILPIMCKADGGMPRDGQARRV